MRALQVQQFGDPATSLQVAEVDEGSPGPSEVKVRVAGVGVGYFDGLLIKGEYQIQPPLPFTPGSSFAGVVEEAGEAVTRLAPGDHIAAFTLLGAMAEKITLSADTCMPLPADVPLEDAANFLIPYATALYGLRELGHLQPNETVLVLGASGTTGTTAIEVARAMDARVIACASTEEKRARCEAAGAHVTVDYTDDNWRQTVKSAAGGRGVNVVYDPVGGDLAEPALRCLAPGGRFLVVGFVTGIAAIPLNLPLLKRISIFGVNWGGEVMENPSVVPPVVQQLVDWTLEGRLRGAPDQVYGLDQAGEALSALFDRRSAGKMVIRP
jgi:NADPH2:quinone reductase